MIEPLEIKPKYEKRMAKTINMETDGTIIIHPEKMTNILVGVEKIPESILYYKINEIINILNRLEDKIKLNEVNNFKG